MPIPVDELQDWFNNSITQEFYRVIAERQTEIHEDRRFYEGEPHRTQDYMSWQNGAGDMLQELLDMKDEGTIYFAGEASEPVGDLSEGPTGTY